MLFLYTASYYRNVFVLGKGLFISYFWIPRCLYATVLPRIYQIKKIETKPMKTADRARCLRKHVYLSINTKRHFFAYEYKHVA